MTSIKIPVNLAACSYDIHINCHLEHALPVFWQERLGRQKQAVLITDTHLHDGMLYRKLCAGLQSIGVQPLPFVIEAGEASKSITVLQEILAFCLENRLERSHAIIAFGGGVVGDIAGFAASILNRGVPFIQIPTTLLAQVDSSVGGKTAINMPQGKNLVGSFHQPMAVFMDFQAFDTLPQREFAAGMAEVIKYGVLGDIVFFSWLQENIAAILRCEHTILAEMIARCCQIKADIVMKDEREAGVRALLNLGHSFGHMLEAEMAYDGRLLHGEAVSIGMVMAAQYSLWQGMCDKELPQTLIKLLLEVGLPTDCHHLPAMHSERLMQHLQKDKKNVSGQITLILLHGLGQAFIAKGNSSADLQRFIAQSGVLS